MIRAPDQGDKVQRQVIAIIGTRYPDFSVETEVLGPTGATITSGTGATADEIVSIASEASIVLAGAAPQFTADVLSRLSASAVIRYGVGVDSIDLDAARRLGKWVVSVPDYGTEAVALHTITLVLAGIRRLGSAERAMRTGGWGFAALRPLHLPSSLVAGVVGFGRIGRRVSRHLADLGFGKVQAHDPVATVDEPGVVTTSLDELVATSDVICLHAPGSARPLFDAEMLARCKPGAVLVNTARGSLIDPEALAAALRSGSPALAALDVFSPEPADLGPFGEVLDDMILTPHMAWYTEESERDLRLKAATEALRILEGREPLNAIVRPGLDEEQP